MRHWDPDRRDRGGVAQVCWIALATLVVILGFLELASWRKAYLLTHGNPLGEYRE
jgi:hypothetical protein